MSQDTDHDSPRDLSGAFGRPLTSSLRGLLPPRSGLARGGEVDAVDEPDDEPDENELDDELDDDELDDDELDDDELDDELDEGLEDGVDDHEDTELRAPAPRAAGTADTPSRRVGASAGRSTGAPGRSGGGAAGARPGGRRPVPEHEVPPRPSAQGSDRVPPGPARERAARPSAVASGIRPLDATRTRRPDPGPPSAARDLPAPLSAGGSVNRRWGIARIASRDHVDLLVLLALDQGAGSGRAVISRLRADSGDLLDAPEQTVHRTLHRLARNRLVVRRTDGSGRITYTLSAAGRRSMLARVREWRALSRAFGSILTERSL